MRYVSTRGHTPPMSIDDALLCGLARDGGLFVPELLPSRVSTPVDFTPVNLTPVNQGRALNLAQVANDCLAPFFVGSRVREQLPEWCQRALCIPIELRPLSDALTLLELYLGPTAAFKDFAARFLAEAMSALRAPGAATQTVLVATSGDTGAAVAAAFHHRPGFRVVVLYPDGRVSPRQAHHLGSFGGNVQAIAVEGSFDHCQALVKRAFSDPLLRAKHPLASANSISLGRLLPQMSYYAWLALEAERKQQDAPNLVIPTGNLGNALAAILAQRMGFPLGRIVLASNANRTLAHFFAGHSYAPEATVATLANAMDVGAPSNAERLRWWFGDAQLRESFAAYAIDDAQIRAEIQQTWQEFGFAACPHTACGLRVARQLHTQDGSRWVIAATAHPAKFSEVVEPLIGAKLPIPASLRAMLASQSHALRMPLEYSALCAQLDSAA